MKHLCDLNKKGYEKESDKIENIVRNPKFICKKCIRVANVKDRLCKPTKIN